MCVIARLYLFYTSFHSENKVFRIITDRGSNMVKAFEDMVQCASNKVVTNEFDLVSLTSLMVDEYVEKEKIEKDSNVIKQHINELTMPCESGQAKLSDIFPKMKRDQAIQLALELDELSDESDLNEDQPDDDPLSRTIADADDYDDDECQKDDDEGEKSKDKQPDKDCFVPCVCHVLNTTLKDAFKSNEYVEESLKKMTSIVGRARKSIAVAEQLSKFGKTLQKNVATRWNSILFVARSINNLKPEELKEILNTMNNKKPASKRISVTKKELETLIEVQTILEAFEFAFGEWQSDKCSISKVYPGVVLLQHKLSEGMASAKYTKQLRQDLISGLEERFDKLLYSDLFRVSTLIDPRYGLTKIKEIHQGDAVKRLKANIIAVDAYANTPLNKQQDKQEDDSPYISHNVKGCESSKNESNVMLDRYDLMIQDYLRVIHGNKYMCPMQFWSVHCKTWPLLAEIAQKFLAVPATSASVERMFSISGHIFNPKRRKTGIRLFERLVLLKLNEQFL